MPDSGIEALMRVATRISEGEPLTNELMNNEGVPVALRLVTAAVALTAADMPVNKKLITTAAPAARSATYRDHADLLDHAKAVLPDLVAAQLAQVGVGVTAATLAAQLEAANRIIHEERTKRQQAEAQLAHVASYARELHWALKPEHEAAIRERAEKVRPLRPVESDPGE